MKKIRIAIVEDEMIIANTIELALKKLGYESVGIAGGYSTAIDLLATTLPDLVLLDINLGTPKDGIDLAAEIKQRWGTPFIFITANSDAATLNRAKANQPLAYLVKPFSQNDIFSAIEIGWNNYNAQQSSSATQHKEIVLKVGRAYEKIILDEIIFIKNDHIYMDVYLKSGKIIVVRATTQEIMNLLPAQLFVKINRTYIVQIKYITKIEINSIFIGLQELPISKSMRQQLLLSI
jgi:two-component system response regulator LytT